MMGSWGSIPRFGAMLIGENDDFSGQRGSFCKSLGYGQWTRSNGWQFSFFFSSVHCGADDFDSCLRLVHDVHVPFFQVKFPELIGWLF